MESRNDHERRVMQEAAERERRRMMTPLRSPSRTLRDLDGVSTGAAADRPAAEDASSLFEKRPPLSEAQKRAIDRDFAHNEAVKAGKVEPPLPTNVHVRAWLERRNRAEVAAAKKLTEPEAPPSSPKNWPPARSPFARFGC